MTDTRANGTLGAPEPNEEPNDAPTAGSGTLGAPEEQHEAVPDLEELAKDPPLARGDWVMATIQAPAQQAAGGRSMRQLWRSGPLEERMPMQAFSAATRPRRADGSVVVWLWLGR